MSSKLVTDIKVGDRVDLESCPYLFDHPTAPYEFAVVAYAELETPECMVIGYEGIDWIGYPIDTMLKVAKPE